MKTIKEIEKEIGGRPKGKEKKVRVSVYLLQEELKALKIQCEQKSISVSQGIRKAILKDIKKNDTTLQIDSLQ